MQLVPVLLLCKWQLHRLARWHCRQQAVPLFLLRRRRLGKPAVSMHLLLLLLLWHRGCLGSPGLCGPSCKQLGLPCWCWVSMCEQT